MSRSEWDDDWTYKEKRRLAGRIRAERLAAAKEKGTHTKLEWEIMLAMFGVCVNCGTDVGLTKDHILPVSIGGCDCIANIQPMCTSCNSAAAPGHMLREVVIPDWSRRLSEILAMIMRPASGFGAIDLRSQERSQ